MKTFILSIVFAFTASAQSFPIRVNVGGPMFTDTSGNIWAADTGCTSANTYTYAGAIQGTNNPALYQTGRNGGSTLSCSYAVSTTPAFYIVTLKFAETDSTVTKTNQGPGARPRIMNVFINGILYFANLNVFASSAFATAYDIATPFIPVSINNITINITQVTYQPMLAAIQIDQVAVSPATNIVPGNVLSSSYNFTPQTPGGSLISGSNSIILAPVPQGVNGSDTFHYLYISGTGTPEACLITGGSAVAGNSSGTLTISCANAHSPGWTVQSASSGIKEAAISIGYSGTVTMPTGILPIHPPLILPTTISLTGQGASTAAPALIGTVLSCTAATVPCEVIVDNRGTAAGQGIGVHVGYTLYSSSGASYGLWLGGDPSNVFAPSTWTGSYMHFDSVSVTGFATGLTNQGGNFDVFTGFISNSATNAFYIPSTNTGECQPMEFYNSILTVPSGNAVQMDSNGFTACPITYIGGQVSGTITGADVDWDSSGTHYEPNTPLSLIVNITASGLHRVRISGGQISTHGSGTVASAIVFNGTGYYELNLADLSILIDSGLSITNYVSYNTSLGGAVSIAGIDVQPAGGITNLYTVTGVTQGLSVNYSKYATIQGAVAAATTNFGNGNFPVRGVVELSGTTVGGSGITAVTGFTAGQTGTFYADNIQTFTAGATIGQTITLTANQIYTYIFYIGKIWIK